MTILSNSNPMLRKDYSLRLTCGGVSLTELAQEVLAREALASEVPASEAKNLYELFAPVRGLLTVEEADTLFKRHPSSARPVDFA